jgi:hypothetical protein
MNNRMGRPRRIRPEHIRDPLRLLALVETKKTATQTKKRAGSHG